MNTMRTVLGLIIDPQDQPPMALRRVPVDVAEAVVGHVQALVLDGDGVMWLDEDGKGKDLPVNVLATQIAHGLNSGLYSGDTINGRALIMGERPGPGGDLVSTDLSRNTLSALRAAGVTVVAQASQEVLIVAGGAWNASLNHERAGGNCWVTTQQIDDVVYVVGQDEFTLAVYPTAVWLGEKDEEPRLIEADSAQAAWAMLQHFREDCLTWQCGGCDAFIYTSDRPRIGVLRCATCGDGGVDFRHADRHVGDH